MKTELYKKAYNTETIVIGTYLAVAYGNGSGDTLPLSMVIGRVLGSLRCRIFEFSNSKITVVVSGKFLDINGRKLNYRVQIAMPNCMDEWLLSNVANRYLIETLKNCKEYTEDGRLIDNNDYATVNSIISVTIETHNRLGQPLIIDTGRIPTFYGKSIFDLSYMEIQDVATALGLHEIQVIEDIEQLQKDTVIAYLKRIKKLTDQQIHEMSFYRYDKIRMKYYIEFSSFEKEKAVINEYNCADLEEFIEEE